MRLQSPFFWIWSLYVFYVSLAYAQSTTSPRPFVTTSTIVGLAVSQSGTAEITFTTTIATVLTLTAAPTGGANATSSRTSTSSNAPTAATDIPGGGGGGAPMPGSGGDVNGPNDNYIAGAIRLVSPLLVTVVGGLIAGVGLVAL